MAMQGRRSEEELVVLAGAIVIGLALAGGVNAAVSWLLSRSTFGRRSHTDPVLEIFRSAPIDDEPITKEQESRIDAALAAVARGEVEPLPMVGDRAERAAG